MCVGGGGGGGGGREGGLANSLGSQTEDSGWFGDQLARTRERQRLSKKEDVRYESSILSLNKEGL